MDGRAISFGPFRLLAEQRLLLEGDKPVRLGSRAFDILVCLVQRAGEVVGKEELIARAWPQTFVEEANLKIQVSALRRALGDGQGGNRYVLTVVGRGYNFVAPTTPRGAVAGLAGRGSRAKGTTQSAARGNPNDWPRGSRGKRSISRLSHQRLVTIVGPGGIGKTTVALAVAERMVADYEHGVWLVDLASLGDARLVPSAVATVLGLEMRDRRSASQLSSLPLETTGCCCCSTIVSMSLTRRPAWRRRFSAERQASSFWRPAGNRSRVAGESEYRLGPLGSPRAVVQADGRGGGGFPRRAAVRRASDRDRRRLRADRCERRAGRRDLPQA